ERVYIRVYDKLLRRWRAATAGLRACRIAARGWRRRRFECRSCPRRRYGKKSRAAFDSDPCIESLSWGNLQRDRYIQIIPWRVLVKRSRCLPTGSIILELHITELQNRGAAS